MAQALTENFNFTLNPTTPHKQITLIPRADERFQTRAEAEMKNEKV